MLLLLPVGLAHLATNSVPVTYAGATEVPIGLPTSVTLVDVGDAKVNVAQENGKDYYHFIDLQAHLASNGQSVNDEPVIFTVGGIAICTGDKQTITRGQGLATCNDKIPVDSFTTVPSTFTATFAGDPPLQSSHADGRSQSWGRTRAAVTTTEFRLLLTPRIGRARIRVISTYTHGG